MSSVTFTSNAYEVLKEVAEAKTRALEIMGGKAESYAKQICPKVTGRLQNSITHQQIDEDTEVVGTNVKYAPWVENGHHKTGKRREFVSGKPFIRPAAEDHAEEYREVWQNELSKIK